MRIWQVINSVGDFRLALLCAIPVAGCVPQVADESPRIVNELPQRFVAVGGRDGQVKEQWWEEFDDPLLDEFVEQAVRNNPTVEQASARLRQARAVARLARADRLPELTAALAGTKSGSGKALDAPDRFDADATVSWEVDLWGRLAAEHAAARKDYLATAADLQATRQVVAAETARTYFAVIEAQAQIALSQRVLTSYDELVRQLSLRVKAGVTAQSLAALLDSDRQSAMAGLAARREDYERLVRRLEILTGGYPEGSVRHADALPDLAPTPPTGVPAGLVARRPDVRAARLGVEAAGLRVASARAAFLPEISLTGSAGSSAERFADLFTSGFSLWSIAGRLIQPVFDGGRLSARLEQRKGERDEAIGRYAEVALQAMFEVETALAADRDLAARERAFLKSAEAAEQSVDIYVLRYGAGVDSFFNVLESQQRALNARSAYLATRRARLDNRIDLHLALGGGFGDMPAAGSGATASRR